MLSLYFSDEMLRTLPRVAMGCYHERGAGDNLRHCWALVTINDNLMAAVSSNLFRPWEQGCGIMKRIQWMVAGYFVMERSCLSCLKSINTGDSIHWLIPWLDQNITRWRTYYFDRFDRSHRNISYVIHRPIRLFCHIGPKYFWSRMLGDIAVARWPGPGGCVQLAGAALGPCPGLPWVTPATPGHAAAWHITQLCIILLSCLNCFSIL